MEREKADERIRLLIADDTALLRLGIRAALERDSGDLVIVGEAENGNQALEMTHALTPDVILMDSTLTGVNGIEVTRLIKQQTPTVAVIIMTAFEDEEELFNANQGRRFGLPHHRCQAGRSHRLGAPRPRRQLPDQRQRARPPTAGLSRPAPVPRTRQRRTGNRADLHSALRPRGGGAGAHCPWQQQQGDRAQPGHQ